MKLIKNIYCPICLESDGLKVILRDLKCPQCHTEYKVENKKLLVKNKK